MNEVVQKACAIAPQVEQPPGKEWRSAQGLTITNCRSRADTPAGDFLRPPTATEEV